MLEVASITKKINLRKRYRILIRNRKTLWTKNALNIRKFTKLKIINAYGKERAWKANSKIIWANIINN